MPFIITNISKATLLARKATLANTVGKRIIGLLGRRGMENGEGLIIRPCSSIHTFFMRFPIDILFLDKDSKVVKSIRRMRPFRLSGWVVGAKEVVELPSGVISSTQIDVGDLINIQQSQG